MVTIPVDDGEVIIRAFRLLSYKPRQEEIVEAAQILGRCQDSSVDYRSSWLASRLRERMGL